MDYAIGIDIGSTCAKTAVLAADGSFALLSARPTGWVQSRRMAMRRLRTGLDRQTVRNACWPTRQPCIRSPRGLGCIAHRCVPPSPARQRVRVARAGLTSRRGLTDTPAVRDYARETSPAGSRTDVVFWLRRFRVSCQQGQT